MGRSAVGAALVVFAVSWFVPVVEGQEFLEAMRKADNPGASAEGIPGWQACRAAWDLLTEKDKADGRTTRFLLGITCFTNGAMVLAAVAMALRRGKSPLLGLLLLGCAALNLGWLYHDLDDFRESLKVGYYLWTGSFALAGVGFLLSDHGGARPR